MALSPTTSRGGSSSGGATEIAYVERTSSPTLTATTEAGAQTVISSGALTYTAAKTKIEIFAPFAQLILNTSCFIACTLWDGATNLGWLCTVQGNLPSSVNIPVYGCRYLTPSAGSHTYIWKMWGVGSPTLNGGAGGVGANLPMFIRITSGG